MKLETRSGDAACVGSPSHGLAVAGLELDIDVLYADHAPFIGRVLIRLVGDGPQIDDLLQETFLTAFRRRHTFDGRSSHRTWLYGIAVRLAMRHRRGAGRFLRAIGRLAEEPPPPQPAGPDQDLELARASAAVREALDRLPFKQREVFILFELEEMGGEEIAEMLGIPIGTVWTRLHHARKRCREIMERRLKKEAP